MSNSGDSEELLQASDAVLLRIGRNLIVLQRIEVNLKLLLAHAQISGPVTAITKIIKKQEADNKYGMFGVLIKKYISSFLTPRAPSDASNEIDEPHLTFSIDLDLDPAAASLEQAFVEGMSTDRNALVHHFVEQQDLRSPEHCIAACAWLDSQHERATSFLHRIRSIIYATAEARKEQIEFISSPEFSSLVERDWLGQAPLVSELARIATQIIRTDGWSVFATAGGLLKQRMPEEVASLKVRYGHKTLKSLILATELFDTAEESTPRGGSRLLYRIKAVSGNDTNPNE